MPTIPTIVKRLTLSRPNDIQGVRALGITAKYIDEGAFRMAYKVQSVPLVIKIPLCDCPQNGYSSCTNDCSPVNHSRKEYKVYKKVMANNKYRALRGFMPKIYYFDDATGVIAMHWYRILANTVANNRVCDLIDQFMRQTLAIGAQVDVKPSNVGYEIEYDMHSYKILDMGCIARGV